MAAPSFSTPSRHHLVLESLTHDDDVQRVIALETASYPADEAASERTIRYRQQHAGAFFLAAFNAAGGSRPRDLVGFVNGTLTASHELEEASMHEHDPHGTTLCVHSVVIDATYRRQGLATSMLKQYVRHIVEQQLDVTRIVLIAKANLIAFYVNCGFVVTKLSPVVHGKDQWFELAIDCVAARRLAVVQVDAFTADVFAGNPAAVVVLPRALFDKPNVTKWMQNVAMENNLSETAFVTRRNDQQTIADVVAFDLRWFTPAVEVAMCGHATLSTAFVLFHDGHVAPTATIHFHTQSGVLVCQLDDASAAASTALPPSRCIRMEFPRGTLTPVDAASVTPSSIAQALGIPASTIVGMYRTEQPDVLVHVTPAAFVSLAPDFTQLAAIDTRGVVVTAEATEEVEAIDFVSRWFGARVGVNEDPVTGSAHCALATYWADVLGDKTHLRALQACPQRSGIVTLELPIDRPDVVVIKGDVVVALRGELLTAP